MEDTNAWITVSASPHYRIGWILEILLRKMTMLTYFCLPFYDDDFVLLYNVCYVADGGYKLYFTLQPVVMFVIVVLIHD